MSFVELARHIQNWSASYVRQARHVIKWAPEYVKCVWESRTWESRKKKIIRPLSGRIQVLPKPLYIEHVIFKRGRGNKLETDFQVFVSSRYINKARHVAIWFMKMAVNLVKNKAANLQSWRRWLLRLEILTLRRGKTNIVKRGWPLSGQAQVLAKPLIAGFCYKNV